MLAPVANNGENSIFIRPFVCCLVFLFNESRQLCFSAAVPLSIHGISGRHDSRFFRNGCRRNRNFSSTFTSFSQAFKRTLNVSLSQTREEQVCGHLGQVVGTMSWES